MAGIDTYLDALDSRALTINAQAAIIANIVNAISQDLSVNANREAAKAALLTAAEQAVPSNGTALATEDRQFFIDQVVGVKDSLA